MKRVNTLTGENLTNMILSLFLQLITIIVQGCLLLTPLPPTTINEEYCPENECQLGCILKGQCMITKMMFLDEFFFLVTLQKLSFQDYYIHFCSSLLEECFQRFFIRLNTLTSLQFLSIVVPWQNEYDCVTAFISAYIISEKRLNTLSV